MLNKELAKVSQRLSRLYDARLDGEITDAEAFKAKEAEYKAGLAEIKAQIRTLEHTNPAFYEDASKILELSKQLFPLFIRSNLDQKAKILKLLASNYILNDLSIVPIYRKPFDAIAKGPSHLNLAPREGLEPPTNWLTANCSTD